MVGNRLVAKTVENCVQGNQLTLASAQLRSIEIQVAAELNNLELSRSGTTLFGGGRHSIDTGNSGRLNSFVSGTILLSSESSRTSPSIGSIRDVRRSQDSRSTLANHIVTRDCNLGSGENHNGIIFSNRSGVNRSANRVGRSGGKGISAGHVQVHGNLAGSHTRHQDTVHVPIDSTFIFTFDSFSSNNHCAAATKCIFINRNRKLSSGRFNDINNNIISDVAPLS